MIPASIGRDGAALLGSAGAGIEAPLKPFGGRRRQNRAILAESSRRSNRPVNESRSGRGRASERRWERVSGVRSMHLEGKALAAGRLTIGRRSPSFKVVWGRPLQRRCGHEVEPGTPGAAILRPVQEAGRVGQRVSRAATQWFAGGP